MVSFASCKCFAVCSSSAHAARFACVQTPAVRLPATCKAWLLVATGNLKNAAKNTPQNAPRIAPAGNMKFWLSPGRGGFALSPDECIEPVLYAIVSSEEHQPKIIEGYKCMASALPAKPALLAGLKSTNYLLNALATIEAQQAEADMVRGRCRRVVAGPEHCACRPLSQCFVIGLKCWRLFKQLELLVFSTTVLRPLGRRVWGGGACYSGTQKAGVADPSSMLDSNAPRLAAAVLWMKEGMCRKASVRMQPTFS